MRSLASREFIVKVSEMLWKDVHVAEKEIICYEYGRCCFITEPVWQFKPFHSCSMMRRPSAVILSRPSLKKKHSEWTEQPLLTHDKVDSCQKWHSFLLQYNGKWGHWLQKLWPYSAHSPSIRLPHSFNSEIHPRFIYLELKTFKFTHYLNLPT